MSAHREGPVRSEAARVAVLEATARLFGVRGYDNLTMEGVAAEAGVSKQTIYRWWPSKGALVADCLLEGLLLPDRLTPPNTGDVHADFVAWLGEVFAVLEQPGGEGLIRSLIAAAAENADVGRRLHESLGAKSSVTARLQSAVEISQLRSDAPLDEMGEALVGAVILRALSRAPAEPGIAERLVSAVLGQPPTRPS
ncbi:TetR/AcrR family transcriptional regulator [Glaciibacter superstes]|uniref:TetR/AcrR family transcriptional regulator n=1 Tax=Glaciibacter superstes TaxID=501023 RepID=UPI0003B4F112|nr:TetR/AcrR family transcriptional regulator [Glaciibacter superstes]